jgi:hypothetical protein
MGRARAPLRPRFGARVRTGNKKEKLKLKSRQGVQALQG